MTTDEGHPFPQVLCSSCVASHPPRVVPRAAGYWEVQLLPAVAGEHTVHVRLGSSAAVGSPYPIEVRPGLVQVR